MNDYERIEKAILYLKENFRQQPHLDEVAEQVNLSPFHFQRLFTQWAGVSPKKFLQYLSAGYAKELLQRNQTLAEVAHHTGLSGTSRLHDLFVSLEGMTPGEYKNGGQALTINYSFETTLFGNVLIASTTKGICFLAFIQNEEEGLAELKTTFPKATFVNTSDTMQMQAIRFISHRNEELPDIKLFLQATPFQLKVWQSLLQIPSGSICTYSTIAHHIQQPKASRAVGSAIGSNPVAYLIPCHRVIQSTGMIGGYRWGSARKTALLGWEAARHNPSADNSNATP